MKYRHATCLTGRVMKKTTAQGINHNLDYNNVIYDDTYENVIFRNRIK